MLVWVLAFLLYGPAILSWEYLSGGSSIPEGHCYAEFFYNWYFLITASTLEFFTPFLSVTFFNLSIYLNIQRRTRVRLDGACEAAASELPPEAQPTPPPAAPSCWDCWQKGCGEAVPLHRCGVGGGEAAPGTGAEAGDAALGGGSGGGAAASPTSSSGSSSRGAERPRSLKRGSKPSVSSASLEKRTKMVSQSIAQRFRLSRDKKVAKSLAVIVSTFGLCWAPYTLLMITRAACHGPCVPDYWYTRCPSGCCGPTRPSTLSSTRCATTASAGPLPSCSAHRSSRCSPPAPWSTAGSEPASTGTWDAGAEPSTATTLEALGSRTAGPRHPPPGCPAGTSPGLSSAHPKCHGSLPARPLVVDAAWWAAGQAPAAQTGMWPPKSRSSPGGTTQGSQPVCHPQGQWDGRSCPRFTQLLLGVFPKQVPGVRSRPPEPVRCPCTCTRLHTPAHLPRPRQAPATGFAAVCPLL